MADSLRDQLLKSGIVKQVQPDHTREPKRDNRTASAKKSHKRGPAKSAIAQGQSQQEIDLAKAYALRAQTEAQERKRVEREAAEQARVRRENKQKIQRLLDGKALNKPDADQPRNFEYGGKIRRVHVDAAQWAALNAGELAVVQQGGRYLLVTRELAEQVRDIDPRPIALLVDPGSAGVEDDGVPDDLMW